VKEIRDAVGVNDGQWPLDWERRKAGVDCPMCAALGRDEKTDHAVFVAELSVTEVRLERRSRLAGYCVVIWRHGHVAEPSDLDVSAASEYWADVLRVSRAIQAEFDPLKMNLLTLGNWVPHLHTHVVPRYQDDPAPGGPITWAEMFNDEPLSHDVLGDQAARLRARIFSSRQD
jgi:diadenosine tetraphosphate (Ap4A) HIT family hydrolase